MRCTEVEPLLGHYLSHELDLRRWHAVEKHLQSCAVCAEALELERDLAAALADSTLHALDSLPEPSPLPADFTTQVLARLAAEPAAPDVTEPERAEPLLDRVVRHMRGWHREQWLGVGMAAGMVAAIALVWIGPFGLRDAIDQTPLGTVLSPLFTGLDRAQAAMISTMATVKVIGLQVQVVWHQML